MGILDRLSRLIRANINDLIKRAEDPEKIIEQALEDMRLPCGMLGWKWPRPWPS